MEQEQKSENVRHCSDCDTQTFHLIYHFVREDRSICNYKCVRCGLKSTKVVKLQQYFLE